MDFSYWCILVAILLPITWAGVSKAGASGFDNARPREYLSRLEGWRLRASWAQQNAWEALAPFVAAVLIAHNAGVAPGRLNLLSGVFIGARMLHGVLYIAGWPTLRSIAWSTGFLCVILLFVAAA